MACPSVSFLSIFFFFRDRHYYHLRYQDHYRYSTSRFLHPLFAFFLFCPGHSDPLMTRLAVDTSSIGGTVSLWLRTVDGPSSPTDASVSRHKLLTLLDYQHLPPHLLSDRIHKLNVDTGCNKDNVQDTVAFVETLFKSSLATRRIVSLLISTDTPSVFGVIHPDFSCGKPYTLRLCYIDLTDDYVAAILHPKTPVQAPTPVPQQQKQSQSEITIDEPESTLARSLHAHIIRRRCKSAATIPTSAATATSTTTATNTSTTVSTPASTTSSTPASFIPSSPPLVLSTAGNSRDSFGSDNFIPLLERLIRGEFRMRRLNSRLDQQTLRRFEKLLIRAVLFKFRGRYRLHSNTNSSAEFGVSVAEIGSTLDTLIPLLL